MADNLMVEGSNPGANILSFVAILGKANNQVQHYLLKHMKNLDARI